MSSNFQHEVSVHIQVHQHYPSNALAWQNGSWVQLAYCMQWSHTFSWWPQLYFGNFGNPSSRWHTCERRIPADAVPFGNPPNMFVMLKEVVTPRLSVSRPWLWDRVEMTTFVLSLLMAFKLFLLTDQIPVLQIRWPERLHDALYIHCTFLWFRGTGHDSCRPSICNAIVENHHFPPITGIEI